MTSDSHKIDCYAEGFGRAARFPRHSKAARPVRPPRTSSTTSLTVSDDTLNRWKAGYIVVPIGPVAPHSAVAFLSAALAVAACAPAPDAPRRTAPESGRPADAAATVGARSDSGIPPATCSLERTRSLALEFDGAPLYLNAKAHRASDGTLFIAGSPAFLVLPDTIRRSTVLGYLVSPQGEMAAIEAPSEGWGLLTAVPIGNGRWGVIALDADLTESTTDALWYGMLDGTQWREVTRIEAPAGLRFRASEAPTAVGYQDGVAFAIQADPARQVLFYSRGEHRQWHAERVRRSGDSSPIPQPVAVGFHDLIVDANTPRLAIVKSDLRTDHLALFLYTRGEDGWREDVSVPGLLAPPTSQFRAINTRAGLLFTWESEGRGVAIRNGQDFGRAQVINVPNQPPYVEIGRALNEDGSMVWAFHDRERRSVHVRLGDPPRRVTHDHKAVILFHDLIRAGEQLAAVTSHAIPVGSDSAPTTRLTLSTLRCYPAGTSAR